MQPRIGNGEWYWFAGFLLVIIVIEKVKQQSIADIIGV